MLQHEGERVVMVEYLGQQLPVLVGCWLEVKGLPVVLQWQPGLPATTIRLLGVSAALPLVAPASAGTVPRAG